MGNRENSGFPSKALKFISSKRLRGIMLVMSMDKNSKPDYGIDAPDVLRNFFLLGVGLTIVGFFWPDFSIGQVRFHLNTAFFVTGFTFSVQFLAMLFYVKQGKFLHRDHMLARVAWRGDEQVLDVGTGRGLLMIGAAKHLTSGHATGIDIWNTEDLSDNRIENTLHNAELEGVKDRVEVRNEDAQKMSFPDASFDVVVSNLCIHNIYNPEGRAKACTEIARVLKPGGIAIISDFRHTSDYAATFRSAGLNAERAPLYLPTAIVPPPLRIVVAKRPA